MTDREQPRRDAEYARRNKPSYHTTEKLASHILMLLTELEQADARLSKVPPLVEAVREEHALMHPAGKQMMGDGSWQACPVCEALAAWDSAQKEATNDRP